MNLLGDFSESEKRILIVSLLLLILAAWLCKGYYHGDEHFQILEFAGYKLGLSPATDLPWEYTQRIRPTLQVTIAYWVAKVFITIGAYNPFVVAFVLRLATALLSWYAILSITRLSHAYFPDKRHRVYLLLLSCFLWFNPYLQVRYSSEVWSGLFFCFGFCLLLPLINNNEEIKKTVLLSATTGILLAIAFWCRFQIAFAITGFVLWVVIFRTKRMVHLIPGMVSAVISIAGFVALDSWFYGALTFTPYNYYTVNITQDIAANWGVFPWYFYFESFFLQGIPPVSLVLLLALTFSYIVDYKNPVLWVMGVFMIGHMLVGHKELRFMFPLIYLLPTGAILFLNNRPMVNRIKKNISVGTVRVVGRITIALNGILLVITLLKSSTDIIDFYSYVYHHSGGEAVTIITLNKNPYITADLRLNFYRPNGLKIVSVAPDQLMPYLSSTSGNVYLFHDKMSLPAEIESLHGFKPVYHTIPHFLTWFNINNWLSRTKAWSLYQPIK